jgi:hypothetical protein
MVMTQSYPSIAAQRKASNSVERPYPRFFAWRITSTGKVGSRQGVESVEPSSITSTSWA